MDGGVVMTWDSEELCLMGNRTLDIEFTPFLKVDIQTGEILPDNRASLFDNLRKKRMAREEVKAWSTS